MAWVEINSRGEAELLAQVRDQMEIYLLTRAALGQLRLYRKQTDLISAGLARFLAEAVGFVGPEDGG